MIEKSQTFTVAQGTPKPVGYAPFHPKYGWRLDLAASGPQSATAAAMRSIDSAAQQGWEIQPFYAAQPPAAPVDPSCDTREHMWSQVDKARADGTFSSTHHSSSAGNAELISDIEYAITCAREDRANSAIEWLASMKRKYSKLPTQPQEATEPVTWEDIARQLFAVDGNGFWEDRTPLQEEAYTIRAKAVAELCASSPVTRPEGK